MKKDKERKQDYEKLGVYHILIGWMYICTTKRSIIELWFIKGWIESYGICVHIYLVWL